MNKLIDRIIFCLTNNEEYIDFWNYISKVYNVKYNTKPTLFFTGVENEFNELKNSGRLSEEYGEIYFLPRVPGVFSDPKLDWTCTWGLFYGASKFENEICMLSGIDQIPLNPLLYNFLERYNLEENYFIGWSDAYENMTGYGGLPVYPSSHHIAKGKYFKKIFNIEDNWHDELIKVFNSRDTFVFSNVYDKNTLWGMDELYSSALINDYISRNKENNILMAKNLFKFYASSRIDRARLPTSTKSLDEFIEKLKNNEYSELHAVRPFKKNLYMNEIFENMASHKNERILK